MLVNEKENIEKMEEFLGRKAEGRPLAPEEFDVMAKFVDRVERKATAKTDEQKKAEENKFEQLKKLVPASAFTLNILDSGLPEHVAYILQEAGFSSLGELAVQMKLEPDNILRLQGLGPRAMVSIEMLMTSLDEQLAAEQEAAILKAAEPVTEVALVEAAPVELAKPVETIAEAETASVDEEKQQVEAPVATGEPEEEISLEEIFTLRPEVLDTAVLADDEESDDSDKGKKKKKKSKHVVVTYDPDRDLTMVTKKHKRGGSDWDLEE
jgi:N utilization substance protein A